MIEIKAWIDYLEPLSVLNYWRLETKIEVDFILNGRVAIEVKASHRITERDFKGLRALREEAICQEYIVVCSEEKPRILDGIQILPWQVFLDPLWSGKYRS